MIPYADSNFFPRLYFAWDGDSEQAIALVQQLDDFPGDRIPVTRLHRMEVMHALELHVFQSRTIGQVRITREFAAIAQATFREDCREQTFLRLCTPPEAAVDRQYEELVLRHTAARGFRTYDLLHVAQALVPGCDSFWSFDEKANALAALEGLSTRQAAS